MEEIYSKIPCRENQINELLELLGEYDESLPCSIFISGNMATGKSLCVEAVLRYSGYNYVVINCIECYTLRNLCESILSGLVNDEEEFRCDNMAEFINTLNRLQREENDYKPFIIVFDKAERLRTMDHSVICAFMRLRELCNLNVCTIFITHLNFNNFLNIQVRQPIQLYFPNYNKEELFTIIMEHQKLFVSHLLSNYEVSDEVRSELDNPELFGNFLNAFLSVFYRACRDLIELQHMAKINFIHYCKPIIMNEIKPNNLTKLWHHISPILKASLELLYLRISTSNPTIESPGKENKLEIPKVYNFENILKEELTSTKTFVQSFELPYYAKFLLIAAYLASYNPPKEDKRLFMKNHGKQQKKLRQVKVKAKISEKLNTQLGPKVFTLDRLLAIFYAILEEKIGLSSNLLAQIATLVELNLIAGSKEIDLDMAKYKCIVGYDFISAVAQTVGFNIRKYLFDFI